MRANNAKSMISVDILTNIRFLKWKLTKEGPFGHVEFACLQYWLERCTLLAD